ncbi:MAG TPA: protein kinase [Candidatus Krumholzibacteria bacterium]|nr:protein kinase [Candidatus Krumholzibacteria bacterium]
MLGTTIDDEYEIKSLLGRGAFGTVYQARQLSLHRDVALKMLNTEVTGDKDLERFLGEARLLAALNHPNVVQIHWLGKYEAKPYLVMELLVGRTLKQILETPPLPSVRRTVEIMVQVARGLHAIHALGVIHRDLSTKNIIVGGDIVKVFDLGLAKDLRQMSYGNQEQYVVGTVGYIAPEQIESRKVSVAADVFAFGVVLYEMLGGVNPFHAEHYMSVLYNVVHRDPEPLENRSPGLPPQLLRLVHQCLQKDPEQRPRDLQSVEKILNEVLVTADLDTSKLDRLETLPPGRSSRTSRNPYLNRVMIRKRSDFFGRGQEVKRIYARLNATPPGSVSVVGDRKIGKSSLLNYVYMRPNRQEFLDEPEHMIMVFMDLQQEKDLTMERFVGALLSMASLELHGRVDLSDCRHDLDGIRAMVERLDAAGMRLAILLDEFERITGNANFGLEFFSFLRFLANHYNVAYLTSSARDLQALCHNKQISDSPFFNIFSTMRLSVFRPEEALELIRVPSQNVGRPLAPFAEPILGMAGLFPFFLQMACCHTLESMEEHGTEAPDFSDIGRRFSQEARFHYRHMWEGFDDDERSLFRRVAGKKSIPDALKHVLEELSNRHYISTENEPRLFASTFEEFVKSESPEKKGFLARWFRSG